MFLLFQKLYEEASQVANDAVSNIRTVASFCAEEKVMKLYQKKCEAPIKAGIKQGIISGVGFGMSFLLLFLVYACSQGILLNYQRTKQYSLQPKNK